MGNRKFPIAREKIIYTLNMKQVTLKWVISPIRTVFVSQGDVSDFHHIQGVVGDLIAVWIQDVGVFLSPPPWKSPAELPTVFWQTLRSCGNLIAVRIHIPEFTRRNRFKMQCLIPFWALTNTVTLYFGVIYILFLKCWKYLKEQYFMTAQPQWLGAEREEKHINFQMGLYYGSSRYAIQF